MSAVLKEPSFSWSYCSLPNLGNLTESLFLPYSYSDSVCRFEGAVQVTGIPTSQSRLFVPRTPCPPLHSGRYLTPSLFPYSTNVFFSSHDSLGSSDEVWASWGGTDSSLSPTKPWSMITRGVGTCLHVVLFPPTQAAWDLSFCWWPSCRMHTWSTSMSGGFENKGNTWHQLRGKKAMETLFYFQINNNAAQMQQQIPEAIRLKCFGWFMCLIKGLWEFIKKLHKLSLFLTSGLFTHTDSYLWKKMKVLFHIFNYNQNKCLEACWYENYTLFLS